MKIFLNLLKWVLVLALVVQFTLTISLFGSGYEIATKRLWPDIRNIVVLLALLAGVIYWKKKKA
ncbi:MULTISPECIES: hypothetical protein [Emticicia]|uniref:hypothetical protein n=1 Tax=Emticicia TaxID=312278 RepID=UPI00209F7F83|nr:MULTISPECIES: hypothetical protein [Emticicia]UTA66566.1 hypothetical protein MB380_13245 [Emticicia sp. 21SJ11W-3]